LSKILVFADSNVFIFALRGGMLNPARLVFHLSREKKIELATSTYVLKEVREALVEAAEERGFSSDYFISDFDNLVKHSGIQFVANPDDSDVAYCNKNIGHAADAPVLAAARKWSADILLTDNAKHFTKEVERRANIMIVRPSDFSRFIQMRTIIVKEF